MLMWLHDSAAAVVKDGVLMASAEEERFNRIRHARGYPRYAVDSCLSQASLDKKDIDVIAVSQDPYQYLGYFPSYVSAKSFLRKTANAGIFYYFKRNIAREYPNAKVVYIPHHLAHAASAYRCSGFNEANILTIDASGETETFAYFIGRAGKIERIWDIKLDDFIGQSKKNSIGLVYSHVTNFLNLGVNGEGKTMGLASYGTPRYDTSEILRIKTHKDYVVDRAMIEKKYNHLKRRGGHDLISQEQKDLASSIQHALEESVYNLAEEAYAHSGIRNFCLAGGCALNCNTNSKILAAPFCDALFVQPAANDGGCALGAALEAASILDKPINFDMQTAYWGPAYTNEEIEKFLKGTKIGYKYYDNIEEVVADLLAQGKIIGWFQGRMEIGPRALCNRSIMADPSVPGMNDKVNNFIKHREAWRPFAPVVTEEDGDKFFDNYAKSPFMLQTFYIKESVRHLLPAVTHIDGSSRIQTVNREQNPRCYALLKAFERLKGFPVLMNTSFNDQGEPIVCTPQDAFRCFASTGLDALVMGNFIVIK